ncbi:MAG: hypothetical protein ABJF11_19765 [Reichenbachiella sp.]|uniref:hypothetical protein n=1 Tax=Reichenbachiella sp. TaxID=2184521 RepID=UPI0032667EC7
MKTFAVVLTILGLSILGFMIVKGSNPDTTRSAIFMHPSNFEKPPIEQVINKEEKKTNIPKLEDLIKEKKSN